MATTDRYVRLLVGGLAVLLVGTLVVAGSTSAVSFSAYNAAWDGATDLQDIAETTEVDFSTTTEVSRYANETDALVIILSPDTAYSAAEQEQIRRFLAAGGTVVVAEDFNPHTNDLLAGVGSSSRIDGRLLRDETEYYRSPNISVATKVENRSVLSGVERLTLNHGTAVRSGNATVLARSSEYAYLDSDRDYALDTDETLRARPVVTREEIGNGTLVVVSDPSIFINAMADRPGNRHFARNLFDSHSQVFLDYSHTSSVPPLVSALLWLRTTVVAQLLVGLVGLVGIRVATHHRDAIDDLLTSAPRDGSEVDDQALTRYVHGRNPEWNQSRLRKLMAGVMNDGPKEEDND
ncbi:DUF4350 domain-containing protein [Haloferax sp. S1W]|uniref:DUF4350 domain-containing protein n=1 Tax=Haloferax sp. S1W TaxID=3377110 RepID=UPI0037CA97E5